MNQFERDLMAMVTCPDTGSLLTELEPWLYGSVEALYPILCGTPVLQPDIEAFLEAEVWSIGRAMAEWSEAEEVRHWFFSRYGGLREPDGIVLDTAVPGAGYTGFWERVPLPDFVRDLVRHPPEARVMARLPQPAFGLGLDLGCGQGGMLQHMARVCGRVIGIETSFYLAATANRYLPAAEIGLDCFVPEQGERHLVLAKEPVTNARAFCADMNALPFSKPLFEEVHGGPGLDLV